MSRYFASIIGLMSWGRGVLSFIFCISLSLYLINSEAEDKGLVVQVVNSSVLYPVQSSIIWINEIKSLEAENALLLEENAQLRLKLDSYKQSELENQRLRGYLSFPRKFDFPVLVAQVVSRDPGRLQASCMINRGELDGLSIDMPVFTPTGLVGKVSKVFNNHAYVQFLNDIASKVSVLENKTRAIGILESRNGYELEVEFASHTEVEPGDTLVSSGFGGVFPKGIQVGVVKDWIETDIAVLKRARVMPFQSNAFLEEMFVLKSTPHKIVHLKDE